MQIISKARFPLPHLGTGHSWKGRKAKFYKQAPPLGTCRRKRGQKSTRTGQAAQQELRTLSQAYPDTASSKDSSHPFQDLETISVSPKRAHLEVGCLLSLSCCYLFLQRDNICQFLQETRVGHESPFLNHGLKFAIFVSNYLTISRTSHLSILKYVFNK